MAAESKKIWTTKQINTEARIRAENWDKLPKIPSMTNRDTWIAGGVLVILVILVLIAFFVVYPMYIT